MNMVWSLLRWTPALFFCQAMWTTFTRPPLESVLWFVGTMVAVIAVDVRRIRLALEQQPDDETTDQADTPVDDRSPA